ncbi:hypothetical protein F8M41_007949 [Gigaspora margarita]|uniref:Uncharacterized protein n=1 Tax=Gigaspora margarita TaxID=4874 RepID=A0A8H3X509_GIGMA|nr:hypothetical protein F8M41_007949 [Gigaspora margarita]
MATDKEKVERFITAMLKGHPKYNKLDDFTQYSFSHTLTVKTSRNLSEALKQKMIDIVTKELSSDIQ